VATSLSLHTIHFPKTCATALHHLLLFLNAHVLEACTTAACLASLLSMQTAHFPKIYATALHHLMTFYNNLYPETFTTASWLK
jgi:hypothetical protein